ncbi:MAG TPA: DUF6448 family protein [Candidatus Desulfaltia sp.]|nr:DUF6448 family protein [Candidatus Desulfaltia sp.]
MKTKGVISLLSFLFVSILLLTPPSVLAHCDGMDGPVVKAARKALETGNVNLVLIWVQKPDEETIKEAFEKTLTVGKLNSEAKELADMYFFETLVRIHRAGEGAAFTGLKPAGRDLGPAIPAADQAIESGSEKILMKLLTETVRNGILEHFKEVQGRKKFDKNDVEKGREFVKAYVEFVHYVERIYEATKKPADGHFPGSGEGEVHK